MADRLTFPDVNNEYKPYCLGEPAVYDQNFGVVNDFPWAPSDGQEQGYLDPFFQYYVVPENGDASFEFLDEELPATESKVYQSRTRTSTLGSQQSSDTVVAADAIGSALAKAKQARRRQDAKVQGQFVCAFKDCPRYTKPFGSSSDRRRHLAELHSFDPHGAFQSQRPCPWPQCARSEKSFKRQKNLDEHLAKKHGGQRPELTEEPSAPTNSAGVLRLSSSLPQAETVPLAPPSQSLLASPQLRARRLERSKRREQLKQRIAFLQERGTFMADEIAVVTLEFHQIEENLNHLQRGEKANARIIQTLQEQLAQEDI